MPFSSLENLICNIDAAAFFALLTILSTIIPTDETSNMHKYFSFVSESDHSDSKTVPIVAMTANVFEEDVKKSFDAGMNAHLSKPVDIKQMYAVLDELVTGDGLL